MFAKILRDDQVNAIQELRQAIGNGAERLEDGSIRMPRVVVQAPTGFGKTVIAASIVRGALAKGRRVAVTVPMLSLVDQTIEAFAADGIREVGVVQANHFMTDAARPVQVCTVQTLQNRWENEAMPQADLVLVDEVHCWFTLFEKWLRHPDWQRVPFVGLSATPWTKGLGSYYSTLVVANTIGRMIEQGTLARFKVWAPSHPDLKDVRKAVNGDYHEGDLYERMGNKKLTADIVEHWQRHGQNRPTVCFAVNRAHAAQLAAEFVAAGVPASSMDCETHPAERKNIFAALRSGRIRVICNVDVIGLGIDLPEVSCIVYARPTRSATRFVQNIGRGLRPHPGKIELFIFDHSNTTGNLGFVTDIQHDTLDDGKPKITPARQIALPVECPKCHYMKPPRTAVCPACGERVEAHGKEPIKPSAGTLEEIEAAQVKRLSQRFGTSMAQKAVVYGQLLWYARSKGKKDGWAAHKYRAIYGVWPLRNELRWEAHFRAPEMELASFIKWQNIKYANGRNGDGRAAPKGAVADVKQMETRHAVGLMSEQDLEDFIR